jgi:hypothetical protein
MEWCEGLADGTVQGNHKSAPIPDEPTEDGVTVSVAVFDHWVLRFLRC